MEQFQVRPKVNILSSGSSSQVATAKVRPTRIVGERDETDDDDDGDEDDDEDDDDDGDDDDDNDDDDNNDN